MRDVFDCADLFLAEALFAFAVFAAFAFTALAFAALAFVALAFAAFELAAFADRDDFDDLARTDFVVEHRTRVRLLRADRARTSLVQRTGFGLVHPA